MKYALYIILLFTTSYAQASSEQVKQHVRVIRTITKVSNEVGVPVELMLAIAWTESSYRLTLPSKLDGDSPSYGVFQIKLETAQWVDKVYKHKNLVTPERLLHLYNNCFYACKYMKLLIKRYNGNLDMAIDAYNKGHVVSINSTYVKRVHKVMP